MRYLSFIFFFSLIAPAFLFAQNSPQTTGTGDDNIVYQFPKNGDIYVPIRAALIIRPAKAIIRGHSAQDFSFKVRGEQSGEHSGKIRISDDGETITFLATEAFALNEKVDVSCKLITDENFIP